MSSNRLKWNLYNQKRLLYNNLETVYMILYNKWSADKNWFIWRGSKITIGTILEDRIFLGIYPNQPGLKKCTSPDKYKEGRVFPMVIWSEFERPSGRRTPLYWQTYLYQKDIPKLSSRVQDFDHLANRILPKSNLSLNSYLQPSFISNRVSSLDFYLIKHLKLIIFCLEITKMIFERVY